MRKICLLVFLAFMITSVLITTTQAQTPQETLNQYISDLQKNPNDNALREKIIRHVQTMKPAPAIPEEARRHYVMALTLFKGAKKIEDYSESIEEFKSALLVAPWWAEANRDLGITLEAAKRYDEAISALKLYMVSGPWEEKARAAQDEIYKIEGMKKLAAREREESSPQAIAAREQNKSDDWLKKLDGRRYTYAVKGGMRVIDVRGKFLVVGTIVSGKGYFEEKFYNYKLEIRGREVTYLTKEWEQRALSGVGPPLLPMEQTFIISEDGDRITRIQRWADGDVSEWIYLWQR